tara:strand:+ start:318 stop:665 length:348 start_codon:yes stop_codon:yes gene_type:complete
MFRHCRNLPSVTFLREPGSDRIGCLTTQNLKLAFVTYTNILLRENRVFVNQSAFVDLNGAKSRDMLLDQLSFFSFSFSVPQTVMQKERFAISGKGQVTKRECGFFCDEFFCNATK